MPGKSASAPQLGSVLREQKDGRTTIVIRRSFGGNPHEVWRLLTDPALLRRWAPHTADRDLGSVEKVVFTMLGDESPSGIPDLEVPGAVLVAIPDELLEHSWAGDVLAWSLEPDAVGTLLTLRHTLSDAAMASSVAAGWHLCLDVAAGVLAGEETQPVRGMAALDYGWTELNERYAAEMGVEPTRAPSSAPSGSPKGTR